MNLIPYTEEEFYHEVGETMGGRMLLCLPSFTYGYLTGRNQKQGWS